MALPVLLRGFAGGGALAALLLVEPPVPRADPLPVERPADAVPAPTRHPPVARDPAHLWMAPRETDKKAAAADPSLAQLQAGLRLYADEQYAQALGRFAAAASPKSPLRAYADYYAGVSDLRLKNFESARRRFSRLDGTPGFIGEASILGAAEAAQALGDFDDAVDLYEKLLERGGATDAAAVWLSLANAAIADGDRRRAADAFLHVYYEFPLSEFAAQAAGPLQTMAEVQPIQTGNTRYKLELGRAERLFASRRYADARESYLGLKPHAAGDAAELVALRLAEIDYYQNRFAQARDALRPHLDKGPRQAEARFFHLMSLRGLRSFDQFEALARDLADRFPESSWAEDALNHLGTYYIQQDRDAEADALFRDLRVRFPQGRHGERAAWKAGWAAYRAGNMAEAARHFEAGAAAFDRSDYRPAWLYWAGRARAAMNDRPGATARYELAVADYHNTYYGRLAEERLRQMGVWQPSTNLVFVSAPAAPRGEDTPFPPTESAIRTLLALGLYEPAQRELEFARARWGDSPAITATIAWANRQMAASETGTKQFALARGSITLMRRAYPQFMAAGGELLPREILTTIFPLQYWDLIRKHSAQHKLDPYLVAALVAQESTFVRDIRSHAGAYGLMQIMPATGRQYARKLKLRYSLGLLTTPETNVRMGTTYFADKIREFGGVHLALASYNAGETPVRRWLRERPGLAQDEFIDDIPYPETQHYVKRILGTAEDYRRLYGAP